jgi:toxin HigB-1
LINNFGDKGTEDIFEVRNTKAARKILPAPLHKLAKRKLNFIAVALELNDLKVPPGNKLEGLKGSLKGFSSIRINVQWRIIFKWNRGNASDVEIVDYH